MASCDNEQDIDEEKLAMRRQSGKFVWFFIWVMHSQALQLLWFTQGWVCSGCVGDHRENDKGALQQQQTEVTVLPEQYKEIITLLSMWLKQLSLKLSRDRARQLCGPPQRNSWQRQHDGRRHGQRTASQTTRGHYLESRPARRSQGKQRLLQDCICARSFDELRKSNAVAQLHLQE